MTPTNSPGPFVFHKADWDLKLSATETHCTCNDQPGKAAQDAVIQSFHPIFSHPHRASMCPHFPSLEFYSGAAFGPGCHSS